jgi:uncharacterized coiled-coil DUF342 family protein
MDDTLFLTLEKRIDGLIHRCRELEEANRELESSRDALLAERVNYLSQRQQIIRQMENLIHKLESSESEELRIEETAEV